MTPHQRGLVRESFARLEAHSEIAALMFYQRLFTLQPSLHRQLERDIDQLGAELMHTLRHAVTSLDRLEELHLPAPPSGRTSDVPLESWRNDSFRAALFWMLEHNLGPSFTPEVQEAWIALSAFLATFQAVGHSRVRSDETQITSARAR